MTSFPQMYYKKEWRNDVIIPQIYNKRNDVIPPNVSRT
jgi:hypothetical protein